MIKYSKIILSLLLIFTNTYMIYGQYRSATINDSDGYTNVREAESISSKILFKLYDGEIFTYNGDSYFEKSDWIPISIYKGKSLQKADQVTGKNHKWGFIHISRLKPRNEIKEVLETKIINNDLVSLYNDSIYITIKKQDLTEYESDSLSKIIVWGNDGSNPYNKIIDYR